MNKVLVALLIFLLLASVILYFLPRKEISKQEIKEYSGPVRPTDDEVYFRKTGITRPLGVSS